MLALVMVALLALLLPFTDELQMSAPVYRRYLALNLPGHGLLFVACSAGLLGAKTQRGHRAVAMSCAVGLTWSVVTSLWLGVSPTLNLVMLGLVIAFYRIALDSALGLWALALALLFHGGLVGSRAAGWISSGQLFDIKQPTPMMTVLGEGVWTSFLLITIWVLSGWLANRMRAVAHALELSRVEAKRELRRAMIDAGHGRLSGTRLAGCYQLHGLLGRGGMGEVYAAERVTDEGAPSGDPGELAIKVLHPHLGEVPAVLERFRREAEAVRRLAGHTARLIEVGTSEEGAHFIVMERLHGEDLAALLRRRTRLPASELSVLGEKLGLALDAAHAAGIVHRDLKPQNVFLTSAGEVRLLDFGIARLADGVDSALTQTAVILGSPGYLAPEQIDPAAGEVGPHTDVFALGALLYFALTGHEAFPSRAAAAALVEALTREPPAPRTFVPELPAAVDDVFVLALTKRPADRYAKASELTGDLARALAGVSLEAVRSRARAISLGTGATLAER